MSQPCDLLLRGGTVITMDDAGRAYAPGVVVIRDDAILAAGPLSLERFSPGGIVGPPRGQ